MARFLADEDFDIKIVDRLRRLGHDVQRHQEVGPRGEADPAVLARAAVSGRVLLTHNRRDFGRLHRAGTTHTGILTLPQDPDTAGAVERVGSLLAEVASLEGRLFRPPRPPVGTMEDVWQPLTAE